MSSKVFKKSLKENNSFNQQYFIYQTILFCAKILIIMVLADHHYQNLSNNFNLTLQSKTVLSVKSTI